MASGSVTVASSDAQMDDGFDWEDEEAFNIPPPGEEGSFHSHEGDEELFSQIINGAKSKK